jgi:hypothetical protein
VCKVSPAALHNFIVISRANRAALFVFLGAIRSWGNIAVCSDGLLMAVVGSSGLFEQQRCHSERSKVRKAPIIH